MWGARLRHDGAAAWSWGSTGSNYWGGEYSLGVSSRLGAGGTGGWCVVLEALVWVVQRRSKELVFLKPF